MVFRKIPWIPLLVVLLAGTTAVGVWLSVKNVSARETYVHAFPDLQTATTQGQAEAILQRWQEKGANADIRFAMKLDMLFPCFYGPLLALICLRASRNAHRGWVSITGVALAVAAIAAGLFDLLENTTMLSMVDHVDRAGRIATVQIFGKLKGYLLMASSLYGWLAHFDA